MTQFSKVFAVLGLVLACDIVSPVASKAADVFDFKGTRWKVSQLGTKDVGMAGDLHFDKDRLDGASACNFFGGRYEFSGESGLTIKVDRMTRKGCFGEALELERGYLDALSKVRSYGFVDKDQTILELKGEDGEVVARLVPQVQFGLEDTRLKVVSYLFDGGLYNVNPGTKPTLQLAGGKVVGDTGCTRFKGVYELTDTTIKITLDRPFSKIENCPGDDIQQDRMVLENLELAGRFDAGRNLLRLLHPEKDWAVLWLTKDLDPAPEAGKSE